MAAFESTRRFFVDPITAQTFYREPVNGMYSPWMPLNPSDYHPSRPESHNVRNFVDLLLAQLIWYYTQVLTCQPDNLGFVTNPAPEVHSHEPTTLPPPPTQGQPSSQFSSFEHGHLDTQPPPSTQPRSFSAPALQNPAQAGRTARHTKRSTRAYDPIHGQRTSRTREGGRGRTRGTPNYKPREVEVLLDLVEEELPIASKGWKVVGARFRDWAAGVKRPERTDRSLELKYKQVRFAPVDNT